MTCNESLYYNRELMSYVRRIEYDYALQCGNVYMPASGCTDMAGAINLFTRIDPNVRRIDTFADGVLDTQYKFQHGKWGAQLFQQEG